MKPLRYFAALCVAACMIPVAASARDKDSRKVDIPSAVQVGHVQLQPGTYKVEWRNQRANVEVTFMQGHTALVTVPGTLKMNDPQVTENDVVTQNSGSHAVLREIDFGHDKEAIVFNKGA